MRYGDNKHYGPNKDSINSKYLFIVEGEPFAHNIMNFGNYLWGASGYTFGFGTYVLLLGANIHSLTFGHTTWGWPELDSKDDQKSIILGIFHAQKYSYRQYRK